MNIDSHDILQLWAKSLTLMMPCLKLPSTRCYSELELGNYSVDYVTAPT